MVLVVAYDGSALSKLALTKAKNLAEGVDTKVIAVAVVPDDPDYAVNRGWNWDGDEFDPDDILRQLHEDIVDRAPACEFHSEITATSDPAAIAAAIRRLAIEQEADFVVFGSENAGQITQSVIGDPGTVGQNLAEGYDFDVLIVRSKHSEELNELLGTAEDVSPAVPGKDHI